MPQIPWYAEKKHTHTHNFSVCTLFMIILSPLFSSCIHRITRTQFCHQQILIKQCMYTLWKLNLQTNITLSLIRGTLQLPKSSITCFFERQIWTEIPMNKILNKSQIHLQAGVHIQQWDMQERVTFSMHRHLLVQQHYSEIIQKNLICYITISPECEAKHFLLRLTVIFFVSCSSKFHHVGSMRGPLLCQTWPQPGNSFHYQAAKNK